MLLSNCLSRSVGEFFRENRHMLNAYPFYFKQEAESQLVFLQLEINYSFSLGENSLCHLSAVTAINRD